MMTLTSDFDPWKGIRSVSSNAYYASKRVDESLNPRQRDLHWSLNEAGSPALLIGYDSDEPRTDSMPRFRGIMTGEDKQHHLIIIALQDPAMRDAFLKVCTDIVKILQTIPEGQQRHAVILRLERWSYFFRGRRTGLTEEEQKGLIAELVCFQRVAMKRLEPKEALRSWTGPQRAAHDFVFGQTSIEVKSNRGAGTPNITVSSSSQLSVNDEESLFLYVVEVNQAVSRPEGRSIADYVSGTRELFVSPLDALEFDLELSQVGYSETDDYSSTLWSVGSIRCFTVSQDFPHIEEESLNPAISCVTYKVNLNCCNPFEISEEQMQNSLRGNDA
jgi:hypothetical protein